MDGLSFLTAFKVNELAYSKKLKTLCGRITSV